MSLTRELKTTDVRDSQKQRLIPRWEINLPYMRLNMSAGDEESVFTRGEGFDVGATGINLLVHPSLNIWALIFALFPT
jgi:hypothetical protein